MAESKDVPSDNELRQKLREILKAADMSTATEKSLRKQLEEHFKCNLKPKKQVFKEEIESFLAQCDNMLSEGEEPEPAAEDDGKPAKGKRKGAHTKQSLSEELQAFLGVDSEADVSRGEVVKRIWEYIKEHNLQDPSNKRKILPDDKLRTLFTFPLNMFSINKQISKHCKPAKHVYGHEETSEKPAKKAKKSKAKAAENGDGEAPKKKSGFMVPQKLSAEMSALLGVDAATRGECQKRLVSYAKEKDLQDPENRSRILVKNDAELHALLNVDVCTMFQLQKYIGPHLQGKVDAE